MLYYLHAGVLSDPSAPSSFGAWMSHVASNHVGALSFLLVEFCLFFSVAVLTVIQASQVSPHSFFLICTSLFLIQRLLFRTLLPRITHL